MTNLRAWGRALTIFAALLVACVLLVSCSVEPKLEIEGKKQDFEAMSRETLEGYVTVGDYKDMEISLDGASKEDALWQRILENVHVREYPQEHVYYYIDQLEGQYRYYAEQADISYKEMLEQLGQSDATILHEAKNLTKKDMAYALIVKLEGISLTDGEKDAYFDRYVDKYVENYGYSEDYVKSNMSELIYDSMLYDKTTEFLILNNAFSE